MNNFNKLYNKIISEMYEDFVPFSELEERHLNDEIIRQKIDQNYKEYVNFDTKTFDCKNTKKSFGTLADLITVERGDLSEWTIINLPKDCSWMFAGGGAGTTALSKLPNNFTIPDYVTDCTGMFAYCSLPEKPNIIFPKNCITKDVFIGALFNNINYQQRLNKSKF